MSDYARWAESDQSPAPQKLKRKRMLSDLIANAKIFGLPESDVSIAQEFVEYNEPGCALHHIATQLYEHDIFVDNAFYELLKAAAERMQLPEQEYIFIKELIK